MRVEDKNMGLVMSEEKKKEIIEMHTKEYMSCSEISSICGNDMRRVKEILIDNGVYNSDYCKSYRINLKIINLLKQGMSTTEIGNELGFRRNTISNRIKRFGLREEVESGLQVNDCNENKIHHINSDRHKCRTCQYRISGNFKLTYGMNCNYIELTGHMRGCDAEDCDKYVKGAMLKRRPKKICLNVEKFA